MQFLLCFMIKYNWLNLLCGEGGKILLLILKRKWYIFFCTRRYMSKSLLPSAYFFCFYCNLIMIFFFLFQKQGGTTDVIEICKMWNIRIYPLQKVLSWIEKYKNLYYKKHIAEVRILFFFITFKFDNSLLLFVKYFKL